MLVAIMDKIPRLVLDIGICLVRVEIGWGVLNVGRLFFLPLKVLHVNTGLGGGISTSVWHPLTYSLSRHGGRVHAGFASQWYVAICTGYTRRK